MDDANAGVAGAAGAEADVARDNPMVEKAFLAMLDLNVCGDEAFDVDVVLLHLISS